LRRIDAYFTPAQNPPEDPTLQLLWKCAPHGAAFEPFRSPVQDDEIRSTMGKLFDVHADLAREANRAKKVTPKTEALPQLWIITPTMSQEKLRAANVITKEEEWGQGIYFLGDMFRTGIIVVHQLPKLFADLKINLESSTNQQPDELELLMTLAKSPLFIEYMERATADARTETQIEILKSVVDSLLIDRFGSLDDELAKIVPNIIQLSPPEFTPLLTHLSREELIDRFTPKL
jgi:hypothetical protein